MEDVRGFLRTEVGRGLNQLVEQGRPRKVVQEWLGVRPACLSTHLNAIQLNGGCSILQDKVCDGEGQFGIPFAEVNAANTSQTCLGFGSMDKRHRRDQTTFVCLAGTVTACTPTSRR